MINVMKIKDEDEKVEREIEREIEMRRCKFMMMIQSTTHKIMYVKSNQ